MEGNTITLQFASIQVPEFKEIHGEEFVRFGNDNLYPDFIIELYNKSAKHAAIINGKVSYIYGNGMQAENQTPATIEFIKKNAALVKKSITDVENFGGFYWQVIPNNLGTAYSLFHVSFEKVRSNKNGSMFYFKNEWKDRSEKIKKIPLFIKGTRQSSLFCFKEYRPGIKVYPLPAWLAAINYIQADIKVSEATLTNASSGFSASKYINFFNGKPNVEGKREVTKQFRNEFGGATAEKIVISFNEPGAQAPTIDDLGASDLTKEDFTAVDNLITGNIFSGHSVTHPLLFGIQQAGKLGGGSELRTAFDIFKNTYVSAKQLQMEECLAIFSEQPIKLTAVDPIGLEYTESLLISILSKDELREKLGYGKMEMIGNIDLTSSINSLSPLVANKLLESMTPDEIRSIGGLAPKPGGAGLTTVPVTSLISADGMTAETAVNDNIKNLTAKQHQQLLRIIRQYSKAQITHEVAVVLLKTGLGLNDTDIASILGTGQTFSFQGSSQRALCFDAVNTDTDDAFNDDESVAMVFGCFGESKDGYTAVLSRTATFASDEESALEREAIISDISGIDKIKAISKRFEVRYSYEKRSDADGPVLLPTSRLFCRKLIGLDKFYKREDIQRISMVLGYDVFLRTGGFWNNNGTTEFHCRHEFKSSVVIRNKD